MFADHTSTNRLLAFVIFFVSLILYTLTIAPTASFWDAGEFIAVAQGLQVNHPPGAPFYSLLGRLFSMFVPTGYVAVSVNFISALASALTVMLLYLIIVRLVREWKGHPDSYDAIDKLGMYGGALIGALTFAVTDTFWFNAVEAEVYALSMFFTAFVVWLALKWAENHDRPYNERWLVLIAYMFGLAIGVHLLNVLALFFVALIIYFKKRTFSPVSFSVMGGLAILSFFVIYPFTVVSLPDVADDIDRITYGLIGPITYMFLIVGIITWAIYYTHTRGHRLANIILICYAMILFGYSSYALVFIRSAANPPIDENDPESLEAFVKYLKREQFGETPLLKGVTYDNARGNIDREEEVFFPRRYSSDPNHIQEYGRYSSDLDFFLYYQVNHMYFRYFAWNFIGRDSDIQDSGWQSGFSTSRYEDNPAHNGYFYLPFLLGLLGMIFHFQKDWRRALSVLALFIITGLAVIFYLNQTPFQPRERDYAYVGSFFAFAIWIGMGGVGVVEMIKEHLKSNRNVAWGVLGILFLAVPVWMGYQNYNDHDRSHRYVAPDYAYNLLQSTAPNAILFTNGDNDTFPLWYLQEVEGVRTDVRIVCLSLLNTDWYIKQLRDQWSHESAPLPISLTNEEVDKITRSPALYQPDTLRIPVDKELLRSAFSGDGAYKELIGVKPDTSLQLFREGVDFEMPVDSLDDEVAWYFRGRSAGTDYEGNERFYTQVQDEVILNILRTNRWLRPVYFANTVSTQSQLGLQPYFRFEGKAFRVVPKRHENVSYGWMNPEIHAERLKRFRFREWNHPNVYFDENIRRMLSNYRFGITQMAEQVRKSGNPDSAAAWLRWGEERIPFNYIDDNINSVVLYAYQYALGNDSENSVGLAQRAELKITDDLEYFMQRYDDMEEEITQLQEEARMARQRAKTSRQRKLRSQAQNIISRREQLTREISYSISHLTIIQHIYFLADRDEQALALAERVNAITNGRIGIPSTREENREQMDRFNID